jgi:hypothetical protein
MATNKFNENLVKNSNDIRTQEEQLLNAPYGQQGAMIVCNEHQIYKGDFYCLMALRDDVILDGDGTTVNWEEATAANNPNVTPVGWYTHIPLPVGMPFYGDFKAIMLYNQGPLGGNIQAHCPECPKLIAYYK